MSAGRVYHWKHGWIPISPEAKAYVRGDGPRPSTTDLKPPANALERAQKRREEWAKQQAALGSDPGVKSNTVGDKRITRIDGFPNISFEEPLNDVSRQPPERYREVAQVITDVLKSFPVVRDDKIVVSFSEKLNSGVMADTTYGYPNPIRVNTRMWDKEGVTFEDMQDMRKLRFGLTSAAIDQSLPAPQQVKQFRKNVLTHELGHVLHMRDNEDSGTSENLDGPSGARIDKFAYESVKPRDFGFTATDPPKNGPHALDWPTPRWQVDSLNKQSAYAISNPYEFYAEAFLDGIVNGARATESGKRAVALAHEIYGGE